MLVAFLVYSIFKPRKEAFQNIIFSFDNIFPPKIETIYVASLIVPDPTRYVNFEEQKLRIQYLSDIALQHQSDNAQDQMNRGIERMQTRLSFIALFAVLMASFLKVKKIKGGIVVITLVLFTSIYFYDIHTVDLNLRQTYNKGCIDTTLLVLSKIVQSDSTWYNIDYKKTQIFDSIMNKHSLSRKLYYSLSPDLSQIAFYFVPVTIMLFLHLFYPKTKEKVSTRRKYRRGIYSSPWRRRGI